MCFGALKSLFGKSTAERNALILAARAAQDAREAAGAALVQPEDSEKARQENERRLRKLYAQQGFASTTGGDTGGGSYAGKQLLGA